MKSNPYGKYEIERYCAFCEHAAGLHDENYMLCRRRGIVSSQFVCKKFSYDPLKRKPRRMPCVPIPSPDDLKLL